MVVQSGETHFNLYLRSDCNTKGYCNWFYFRMTRAKKGACTFRINILNMYKRKILFRHNAKPLACFDPSATGADSKWQTN